MTRRAQLWIGFLVAALIVGALLVRALFVDPDSGGVLVLGSWPTRIRAVFVDAETGERLTGVWAVALGHEPKDMDQWWAAKRRAAEKGRLDIKDRWSMTGPDGGFDIVVPMKWCYDASEGIASPPPFYGVAVLVAARDGYERLVIDCTRGTWITKDRSRYTDIHATVELGEIGMMRLSR